MNFAKQLFLYSVFALGTIGLTACGDDGSSANDTGTSSAQEIILSSASETSPLNSASSINAKVLADGKGGWELNLSGSLSFDYDFIPEGHDVDEDLWFTFDSLSFIVGKYGDDGKAYLVDSLNINGNVEFPTDKISMAASFSKVPLNQDKIGCGKFVLYVWAYMGVEEDPKLHYTALKSVDFELQCTIVESSSSEGPKTCTELARQEITLKNEVGSDIDYMSFDAGTEKQVTLAVEDGVVYLQAAAGVKISEEGGALTAGIDPKDPVCMEDMEGDDRTTTEKMEMDAGTLWYIVTTPSGKYPLRVTTRQTYDNTSGVLGLVYYKKK